MAIASTCTALGIGDGQEVLGRATNLIEAEHNAYESEVDRGIGPGGFRHGFMPGQTVDGADLGPGRWIGKASGPGPGLPWRTDG